MLRSNDWYPALASDNVDLVTDPIAKVTGNAIVTADGTEREIDVLVVATGFYTTELPITEHVDRPRRPDAGRPLARRPAWRRTRARRSRSSRTCSCWSGPNTGQGHTSMIFIIESQVAYVRDALRRMRSRGSPAWSRPRRPPTRWNRSLQRRMRRTVWTTGGCQSWYLDAHGRNTTLWPRSTADFRRRLASFDAEAYQEVPVRWRMKTLDDKVVVITGAGSGIGRALPSTWPAAARCSRCPTSTRPGWPRPSPRRRRPARSRVRSDRLDVADRDAFARYALDVVQEFGRVNVVINNAGVALAGDFTDLEYPDIDWIVGVNFWGVVHGTKEFLPHLIASGDGHVVNLSSLFGLVSMPGQSMYNATKYAVRGMTEALREEMLIAGHPVGVTAVHPGGIKTAIARNARVSAKESKEETARALRREAGEDDPRAGRRDHRQRHPQEPRPRAGRHRRPRHAPPREAARLALPGRRREDLEAGAAGQGHRRLTPARR